MKKLLALIVPVVLLFSLLASFPSAGLDEDGQVLTENSIDIEGSLDENPDDGYDEETPEFYNNELYLTKVTVDKNGQLYTGDPGKEFTIHVTGPREYERTFKVKPNETITLSELPSGKYEINEEPEGNYTRTDDNQTVTFVPNYDDRHFASILRATLGSKRNGEPVDDSRNNTAVAMVDESESEGTDIPFPDGTFMSLGIGGNAVYEFNMPFFNGPDVDLGICEVTWPQDESYEYARVEASKTDDGGWITLGYIEGQHSQESDNSAGEFYTFDLGELDWAKYIRITDVSDMFYLNKTVMSEISDTTGESASYEDREEVPDTTGESVSYVDPDDGIDIDYACVRYMGEIKVISIVNQLGTPVTPPVTPPASNPAPSAPATEYYTLKTAVSGKGTILPGPGSSSFAGGITVQLTPEPASGWEFDYWQGDSVDENDQIYINGNKSITAVFKEITASQTETAEPGTAQTETAEPGTAEPATSGDEEQAQQLESSPDVETIVDEEVPQALPKTGGLPAALFIGVGGALVLIGAAGIKRK